MPNPEDTYRAALVRAAELLGGAAPLARRLQVPMPELTRWLAGDGAPSMGTFLKVIDILLGDSRGLKLGPSWRHPKKMAEQPSAGPDLGKLFWAAAHIRRRAFALTLRRWREITRRSDRVTPISDCEPGRADPALQVEGEQ
jgi:hypothetical protein